MAVDEAHPLDARLLMAELEGLGPAGLQAIVKKCRKAEHRLAWRKLVASRTSQIAKAVRVLQVALGSRYLRREKGKGTWTIFALDEEEPVVAAFVFNPPVRHVGDFKDTSITISIVRADLIDMVLLERNLKHQHVPHPEKNR